MAKKDKLPKLPKKVGGVKVPKQLRKSAKSALEIAQNPVARELVSAALVAGAAALTKRKVEQTASPADRATDEADIGTLIRDSVAAFVSGFDKGAEMMAGNIARKAPAEKGTAPETAPKPKP